MIAHWAELKYEKSSHIRDDEWHRRQEHLTGALFISQTCEQWEESQRHSRLSGMASSEANIPPR